MCMTEGGGKAKISSLRQDALPRGHRQPATNIDPTQDGSIRENAHGYASTREISLSQIRRATQSDVPRMSKRQVQHQASDDGPSYRANILAARGTR